MKRVGVGLLGLGTVGSGVARLLETASERIATRCGRSLVIRKALVRDASHPRALDASRLTTDPDAVIGDPEIGVVVETLGGVSPARELVLAALASGKDVVTANKALLAEHGAEIFRVGAGSTAGPWRSRPASAADSDRAGARRGIGGQRNPVPLGDRQRDVQLHPLGHDP